MIITIHTHPNSSQQKIEKLRENEFKVYLHEKPIDNQANKALVKMLSKFFNIAPKDISILKGKNSRIKIVEINI